MNTILINLKDEDDVQTRKAIAHIRHALTDIFHFGADLKLLGITTIETAH